MGERRVRENRIRSIWGAGNNVINGWLGVPSTITAELMAHQDFDSVCVDLQHGSIDYQMAVGMLQAISTTNRVPLARIPSNDPAIIGKLLDAGAYGLICPMVNSRAECEAFVSACRYAPIGTRSAGPQRAVLYAGPDYMAEANATILTFAMIETVKALDSLEEILATKGLDAIYVGPSDLSLSMGEKPGYDPEYPKVLKAIKHIAKTARRHDVVPCIHVGSAAYALRMFEAGYRLISYASDYRFLQWSIGRSLAALRKGETAPDAL
jgi:4-hydroxy-2-oxoheptanedioate aldolase